MDSKDNRVIFFIVVLFFIGVMGYLTYEIIAPFLGPIAWATVFSIIFYPVYVICLKWFRIKSLASLATLLVVALVIFGPISSMGYVLVLELGQLVQQFEKGQINLQQVLSHPAVQWIVAHLRPVLEANNTSIEEIVGRWLAGLRAHLLEDLSIGAKNILTVIFDFVLMMFTIFFFLKDGPDYINRIKDYLPFPERHKNRLIGQARDMVVSTIFGGVLVAIIQGLIGGVTFLALGVSSPVFWGALTFITSFVPIVGTAGVWLPGSIYFFLAGHPLKGLTLLLVGVFLISMLVDYFLRPFIIGGKTKMNTLLIFFSVLGGVEFFGIIGLVLGPLTLAIFISVLEIFGHLEGGGHAES